MEKNRSELTEQLKEQIQQADKILVGIGGEFEDKGWKNTALYEAYESRKDQKEEWMPAYIRACYDRERADERLRTAYQNIAALLQGRDYFVITLQSDSYARHSGLEADRIAAPCGDSRYLQCENNCSHRLVLAEKELESFADGLMEGKKQIKRMCCPDCGAGMNINRYPQEHYCEDGYLEQWNSYREWVAGTMNRRIVLIEAGVDFTLPGIIRWPFEKMAFYNNKAYLFRIHERLSQISEELHGKACAVPQNAVSFFAETDVQ